MPYGGNVYRGAWQEPQQRPQQRIESFQPFSPAAWQGKEPPPYDWIVEGAALKGTVVMLSGDGGLGKSLLMQQLCTSAALGADWLGMAVKPVRSFFFGCEDDMDELHRRQHNINRHLGCEMGDLGDFHLISRPGKENGLVDFDRRTDWGQATRLFDQLSHAVKDFGAQIVVLDTVADVFSGNEIIRNQVRRFITTLRQLALELQGCIILTAHPSNEGLASGSGISGNRAWNNSVRSRLYLTRDGKKDDDGERDVRWLKTMKSNQAAAGGKLKLRWERGVFKLADQPKQYRDFTEAANE